jgi:peptidoglycan/xylan/chitin deacetylase (PgdA/CDA1 family)
VSARGVPDGDGRFSRRAVLGGVLGAVLLGGVARSAPAAAREPVAVPPLADVRRVDPHEVIDRYTGMRPVTWGTRLPGVLGRAPVRTVFRAGRTRPVGCLTFDACASPRGGAASNGFDAELVEYLRARRIPATLFLSFRWARAHPHLTATLADDPLFEIGNHGTLHRPVTVGGRSAYGIAGTGSAAEAVREVWQNTLYLEKVTGRRPTLFRSGTAHYDDVGVAIVRSLGLLPVGFGTNADLGATASSATVSAQLRGMASGGIALAHMNRPAGGTAEGVRAAVPRMQAEGRAFRRVSDVLRH